VIKHEMAKILSSLSPKEIAMYQETKKDVALGFILTLFMGGFGGQFFYLGKKTQGILCAIFFWTFIPSFIALIYLFLITGEINKYNLNVLKQISSEKSNSRTTF
jgi:TM2 domain-containing membrane protein YozV